MSLSPWDDSYEGDVAKYEGDVAKYEGDVANSNETWRRTAWRAGGSSGGAPIARSKLVVTASSSSVDGKTGWLELVGALLLGFVVGVGGALAVITQRTRRGAVSQARGQVKPQPPPTLEIVANVGGVAVAVSRRLSTAKPAEFC